MKKKKSNNNIYNTIDREKKKPKTNKKSKRTDGPQAKNETQTEHDNKSHLNVKEQSLGQTSLLSQGNRSRSLDPQSVAMSPDCTTWGLVQSERF